MAPKGKALPAKGQRTIAELEGELQNRTAERDIALARENAIAELLRVINSSPGDLASVFEAILDKGMQLCGAAFSALMSYNGEQVRAVSTRGFPPALADLYADPMGTERAARSFLSRFRAYPIGLTVQYRTLIGAPRQRRGIN